MKLHVKILKIFIIPLLISITVLYIFSKTVLLENFTKLEIDKISQDTTKILKFIENDINTLNSFALDYSMWDDTFDFVENYNENYIISNFSDLTSLKSYKIDFISIIDTENNIKFNKVINYQTENTKMLNETSQNNLILKINSIIKERKVNPIKGVLISNNIPLVIIAQPIVTNDGNSISKGTFILGKYLDDSFRENIVHNLDGDIEIQKYNSLELNENIFYSDNDMIVIGSEALIRWKFEDRIIYPGAFIDFAKDIGAIIQIDNWMLHNACLQCKTWHNLGCKDLYISVNISFKQIHQPNFVEEVFSALDNSKLDYCCLNLEITEDEAMEDVELTINTLKRLKAKGIRISLDDFGTGYSSLSYVNKLPIDTLKIDRSLIQYLDQDSKTLEIIKTIILMAHSLNIKVVAEGIENEQQLNILKMLSCDAIQGYYISKPIESTEFEKNFL